MKRQIRSRKVISFLKGAAIACTVCGGIAVASNTGATKFGFIPLALGSGQSLIAGFLARDKDLMLYSGSIFFFVDCLGVYRWLFNH